MQEGDSVERLPLVFQGNQNILEDYLREYLIENKRHFVSAPEKVVRGIAALFGVCWGIPWTQAAAGAALIFPSNIAQLIFGNVFKGGIVLTVGADSLWIMLEIGKDLGAKTLLEKRLIAARERDGCVRFSRIAFPGVLALFSCIPSVYATIKYNTGAAKFFGIITFVGNYGNGFYGYHKLIEEASLAKSRRNAGNMLIARRARMLRNLDDVIRGVIVFNSREELIIKILRFPEFQENDGLLCDVHLFKKGFQIIFALTIAGSVSLVDIFLTKEFFVGNILNSAPFGFVMSIFSEIPSAVVSCISSYIVLGRFFDFLRCRSEDPITQLTKEMYPKTMFIASLLLLLLSLTAPTAAAYITNNTLGEEGVNAGVQWSATVAMIAARLLFSNFTLNNLIKMAALLLFKYNYSPDEPRNIRASVIRLRDIISRAHILHFRPSGETFGNMGSVNKEGEAASEVHRRSFCSSTACTIL